jgi:PAS domain S-box-containing protein
MRNAARVNNKHRKQAKEAPKASEKELGLIINTIPALAWSASPDGSAEFLNQHYLAYVGLPLEKLQGGVWTAAVHPDDLGALADKWQSIMSSGKPGEAEARLRRFDGEYRWFLFRANPMRDESGAIVKWFGINTDTEDRKHAQDAVAVSEHNLRSIINTIPTTAWTARPDGQCDFLNQRWLDYAGMTAEQALGWGWAAAIHPDDRKRRFAGSLQPLCRAWSRPRAVPGRVRELQSKTPRPPSISITISERRCC